MKFAGPNLPLTMDGEDFSGLPETGILEYYDPADDRRISTSSIVRHELEVTSIFKLDEIN